MDHDIIQDYSKAILDFLSIILSPKNRISVKVKLRQGKLHPNKKFQFWNSKKVVFIFLALNFRLYFLS